MFLKQIQSWFTTIGIREILILLVSLSLLNVALLFIHPTAVSAIGNCPGTEVQGTGSGALADTGKCYLNNQPTANTPTGGAAAPGSGAGQSGQTSTTTEDGTTCAVEKIGWILCPVIETAATIGDKTFSLLANNFLQVDPRLLADQGAKPAWEQARNLANIMFVVAFLAIIYSQITGSGLNNYGIKRMLPRLIIAAIAVNASYYICQIMVDLSNIMGFAIKEFLARAANEIGPSILGGSAQGLNTETNGGVLSYIAIAALALAGFIWLILGPLALIITTVVVTAVTIIAILLLRKAILILLVVISPIAFVLYLLPNTEKLFDKWLKMFWGLLMVFPVVALLFGSGQLASTIILMAGSAPEQYQDTTEECVERKEQEAAGLSQAEKDDKAVNDGFTLPCEKGFTVTSVDSPGKTAQSGMMLGLVATGIAVAPLLAVWAVLKGALAAAGAIGGRIAAGVQKGAQGGIGGGSKKLQDAYSKSTMGQMRARDKKIRDIDIKAGTYEGKGKNFNPRNVRSRMNSRLNSAGKYTADDGTIKTKEGFLNSQLGRYADQRGRMASKDEAEYIRDKAQEFIALGNYGSNDEITKHISTLADPKKSMSDKKDAENRLKAHRMAVGNQEGKDGINAFDTKVLSNGGASSSNSYVKAIAAQASARGSATNQSGANQAGARQSAPHMPSFGSGGGAPSTNQPTSQQAQRLSFNSNSANGGIVAKSGHNVIGQAEDAGGFSALSNDDLINAGRHAAQNQGGDGHDELGQKVVEELQNRGIDPNQHL